jgi:hypothetical protein
LPVLPDPSQILPDRGGLLPVDGGGFPPGNNPDLEPDLNSERPPVLIHIIADNAGTFIIWWPFLLVFPLARWHFIIFAGHFSGLSPSFFFVQVGRRC